jgi:arylsulfatase A-like enzyme
MDRLLPLLEEHQGGPLFAFAHMLDAHSPYNSVVRHGPPFERYVAEVGAVDAQLKRLRTALSKPSIKDRACLIVYSDHGEAFGEHGLTFHGQALYDVLLRVPLMIWTPGRRSARIDTPVSLVDIGPTVLDLFGLATPGTSMGQSLAPLLTGDEPALTRPIVAEARLKRAMVFPDGVKIIHDTRMRTVQLYDLRKDPKEEDNLFDGDSDDARRRLGLLKRLFDAHALDRPGYRPPYRKW